MILLNPTKKAIWRRISIVRGQLTGLMLMVEKSENFNELFIQTRSIERAIRGIEALLLEDHLKNSYEREAANDKFKAVKQLISFFKR